MIRYLQRLRSRRGFTLIELIVVVAVIAILVGAVAVGLDDKQKRIRAYQSSAQDFYSAVQTAFTNFQMFDAPLTTTLNSIYTDNAKIGQIKTDSRYAGIMYYPLLKGNYPIHKSHAPTTIEALRESPGDYSVPETASIFIEVHGSSSILEKLDIRYAESMDELIAMRGQASDTLNSELSIVLKEELKDKIDFESGYYIAKITYTAPTLTPEEFVSKNKAMRYRENGVKVEWAGYSKNFITSSAFSANPNVLSDGNICGIFTGSTSLGVGTANSTLT